MCRRGFFLQFFEIQGGLYEKVDVSAQGEEREQITGKQVCQFLLEFDKIYGKQDREI